MVDPTVLVVSDRPIVQTFFSHVAASAGQPAFATEAVIPASVAAGRDPDASTFAAAVIDVFPDASTAIHLCHALRSGRPELPIAAIGCWRSASPWDEAALAAHADAMLDFSVSTEEAFFVLRGLVRPHGTRFRFRRRLTPPRPELGLGVLSQEDAVLIEGVARGLSNKELGGHLHLSRFGIDHRIERACRFLGLRNRTELAAWGGLHRLYRPQQRVSHVHFSPN